MDSALFKSLRLCLLALGLLSITPLALATGDLSARQVGKLIANMPGFNLKSSSVRVNSVRSIDASTFEAAAEITTAFRLEENSSGQWRVVEFRTGQNQWQGIEIISRALKVEPKLGACDAAELAAKTATDPSIRRARCLLAELLGVTLPSDAIRIKAISTMPLPFSSKPSALVEALVAADFRFQKGSNGSWRVAALRTGTRDWTDPKIVFTAVNSEMVTEARAELESIAKALEDFRGQRGFYVAAKSERVLIDFLSPRYLSRVIRLDPWRRPYLYEGTRDQFTLRSLGPDGKESTSDDIVLSKPTHATGR